MPRSLLKPFRKSVASEDRPSAPQDSTHALRVGSCSFGGLPVGTSHAPAVSGSQNARPVSVLCDLLGAAPSLFSGFLFSSRTFLHEALVHLSPPHPLWASGPPLSSSGILFSSLLRSLLRLAADPSDRGPGCWGSALTPFNRIGFKIEYVLR